MRIRNSNFCKKVFCVVVIAFNVIYLIKFSGIQYYNRSVTHGDVNIAPERLYMRSFNNKWTSDVPPIQGTESHGKSLDMNKYYISIKSRDWRRLGNLMFNYAALLGIAKTNNMVPMLKLKSQQAELLNIFKLSIKTCKNDFFKTLKNKTAFKEHAPVKYDNRTHNLKQVHTELLGAYESFKYFEDMEVQKSLREQFGFKAKYLTRAMQEFQRKKSLLNYTSDVSFVGIHVRRGDMASKKLSRRGFKPPDAGYFTNATNLMQTLIKQRIVWVVSSDDIPWCQNILNLSNVMYTNTSSYVTDLAILSMCDHMIISAGSYGWWAAWLVNGTTIFNKNWPIPGSRLTRVFNYEDYYYPHWIPMT